MRQTNRFGECVRAERKAKGLSVTESAHLINISESYLSTIERGLVPPPSAEVILRIEKELGLKEFILFYYAIKDGYNRVPRAVVERFAERYPK